MPVGAELLSRPGEADKEDALSFDELAALVIPASRTRACAARRACEQGAAGQRRASVVAPRRGTRRGCAAARETFELDGAKDLAERVESMLAAQRRSNPDAAAKHLEQAASKVSRRGTRAALPDAPCSPVRPSSSLAARRRSSRC
jgi:hypothetical protein